MTTITRQKVWFALFVLVIFVMGFGSGVGTSRYLRFGGPFGHGRGGGPYGRGPGGPGGPGGIPPPPPSAARIAESMARDLQLTSDQQKQVEQAFERGAERLEKFRTATREQFDTLKKQLDDDIDRVLTPEQRVKHQAMREEERRRRPPPPGGRGPGGPGGPPPGGSPGPPPSGLPPSGPPRQ
jgi:Spy/CpxP family protein refolding chaperone